MAAIIDKTLTAVPATVHLQAGEIIDLVQTVHSDLGGEPAKITYSLDARTGVHFATAGGPAKSVVVETQLPGTPEVRTDRVSLVEVGDTDMAQVVIQQLIEAETAVRDSVVVGVVDVD